MVNLVVFEGPDGVGKTTLVGEVAVALRREGVNAKTFSFPGSTDGTLGKAVYDLHHSSYGERLSPLALQVLHVASHIQAIRVEGIEDTLRKGDMVLLDRYWWSTEVYGLLNGCTRAELTALISLERIVWGDLLPRVVYLLAGEPHVKQLPDDRYRRLSEAYSRVASRESKHHPVVVIEQEQGLVKASALKLAKRLAAGDACIN